MLSAIAQAQPKNYCKLISAPKHLNLDKKFAAGQWVNLIEPLSSFSFDEALLLCEESQDKWLGWVPGFGEKHLDISEFL